MSARKEDFLNEVDVEEISQEDFLNDSVTKWYYFYDKKKELSFEWKKNKVTFASMVQERIFRSTDPPSILKYRGEKRKRISFKVTDESSGGM